MQTKVACCTSQEAVDLLRYCVTDGEIIPGRHFRDELANEALDMGDVFHVLRNGMIYDPPEVDIRTGEEKWRVVAGSLDDVNRRIAVVFSFKSIDRAFLITIFSVLGYRRGRGY